MLGRAGQRTKGAGHPHRRRSLSAMPDDMHSRSCSVADRSRRASRERTDLRRDGFREVNTVMARHAVMSGKPEGEQRGISTTSVNIVVTKPVQMVDVGDSVLFFSGVRRS